MKINTNELKWTRTPRQYSVLEDRVEMITEPYTDLWQRTYYHFRNDNAPVLQMETDEKFFSFTVKTEFEKFGSAVKAAQNRLEQASDELDKLVGVRTRQIQRKLANVTNLADTEAVALLEDGSDE